MERNEAYPTTVDCAIKSAKVSLSAFSYIFSELIQYSYRKANHINDLHRRLSNVGYNAGLRLFELIPRNEKAVKRETQLRQILIFISTKTWKYLFGKPAVLCSTEREGQCTDIIIRRRFAREIIFGCANQITDLITEDEPLLTKYITTPRNMPGLNCGTFLGGLVEGILDAAEFPAKVSTHFVDVEGLRFPRTVILIEFSDKVIERD